LSGHVVAARSAKHLAEAIVTVLDDHEWRKNAAIQGPAFVAKRFGIDRMLRETLEVYGLGSKGETNGGIANAWIGPPDLRL
jgi:glycosyltransferase involved in cell wall biosynthesis